jgi:hypothetical protein
MEFRSMPFRRSLLFCAALAFSASLAIGDPIPLIYGVTDSNQFGTLNLNTQAFSLIAPLSFTPYSMVSTPGGFLAISAAGGLESVSYGGATTLIGNTGLTPDAMAEIGSTVYLLSVAGELYTVNTTNASVSAVGSTGLAAITGPYDSSLQAVGGNLYYTFDTETGNGTLYEINPSNASTTTIGPTTLGIDAAIFLGGTDYVFTNNDLTPSASTEYILNLANGNTTLVGGISGGTGLLGVAAPVPEPGLLILTFAGLLGIVCLAWIRNRRPTFSR